jgi:hypothetical protein
MMVRVHSRQLGGMTCVDVLAAESGGMVGLNTEESGVYQDGMIGTGRKCIGSLLWGVLWYHPEGGMLVRTES